MFDPSVIMFLQENNAIEAITSKSLQESVDELNEATSDIPEMLENIMFSEEMVPIVGDQNQCFIEYSDLMRVVEYHKESNGDCTEKFALDKIAECNGISSENLCVILPSQDTIDSYVEACKSESCKSEGCKSEGCKKEGCKKCDKESDDDDDDDEFDSALDEAAKKKKAKKKISGLSDSVNRMKKQGIKLFKKKK